MAKKINFKSSEEINRASNTLKDLHVEHVKVVYDKHEPTKCFIIVRNCLKDAAVTAIQKANIPIRCIKSARHYESWAIRHDYYEPKKNK